MDAQIIVVVVGLIVTAIAAYRVGGLRWHSLVGATDPISDATYLISKFAPAADQLVKLGELAPEDRKAYVIGLVMDTLKNIDIDQVEAVLEAWVVESKQPKEVE